MVLSVLSALARLGMDPWQEAGRLATLPRSAAVEGLARIIAGMPASRWSLPDATSIAARLVALLPARGGDPSASFAVRRAKAATFAARLMPPAHSRLPARSASPMRGQWAIVLVLLGAVLVKLTFSLTGQPAVAPNAATRGCDEPAGVPRRAAGWPRSGARLENVTARSSMVADHRKDSPVPPTHDPLAAELSPADDRLLLNHWLPPQEGIVPRVRIGRRWVSVLWALPIAAAALIVHDRPRPEPAGASGRPGVHPGVWRHPAGRAVGRFRLSLVAAAAALPEHAVHDVHHPRRHPDPRRPSEALLEAGLHARHGLVPLPAGRPDRAASGRRRTIP